MGPGQLLLVAIVASLLLVATNRYVKQQREELKNLEPPASLDAVGTWEAEVLAAEQAAAAATEGAAQEPPEGLPDELSEQPPEESPEKSPEEPPGEAGRSSY